MLAAIPAHWYSRTFTLEDDGVPVGTLTPSLLSTKAALEIDGVLYEASREGPLGAFVLTLDGETVAAADKKGIMGGRFEVAVGGRIVAFDRQGWTGRRYHLLREGVTLGRIERRVFSRRIEADLPMDLPLHERAFLLWLAYMMWQREQAAASS